MRDIRILLALLFVSHVAVAGTLPVTVVSAARIHTMDREQTSRAGDGLRR
jgi:hypothetical protein